MKSDIGTRRGCEHGTTPVNSSPSVFTAVASTDSDTITSLSRVHTSATRDRGHDTQAISVQSCPASSDASKRAQCGSASSPSTIISQSNGIAMSDRRTVLHVPEECTRARTANDSAHGTTRYSTSVISRQSLGRASPLSAGLGGSGGGGGLASPTRRCNRAGGLAADNGSVFVAI